MSQLMGQRKGVVVLAGVVQKHIWVYAVHAAGVRAGGLSPVLINVDPFFIKGAPEQGLIGLSHGLQRPEHQLLRLRIGHVSIHILHEGHIEVIELQLVQAQLPAAQFQIAAERGNRVVHAVDEVLIQRNRHVVRKQPRLQRASVAACLGIVAVQLHIA